MGAKVSRDGVWRTGQVTVERDGRPSIKLRVSRHRRRLGSVADIEALCALGVPVEELIDEEP